MERQFQLLRPTVASGEESPLDRVRYLSASDCDAPLIAHGRERVDAAYHDR